MKTVILVSDYAEINGGAAKIAIVSALGLAEAGFHVVFFAGSGNTDSLLMEHKNIEVFNLHLPDLLGGNKFKMFFNGICNRFVKKEFEKILESVDLDNAIVHIHSWVKVLSPSIFLVLKKHHVKFFITAHDYFLQCPNGGFFDYRKNLICTSCKGLKCLCKNCDSRSFIYKVWRCIRKRFQDYCLKNCKYTLIIISSLMDKNLNRTEEMNRVLLRNPIDLNNDFVNDFKMQDSVFAYIGRVSKEKGIEYFCEALTATGCKGIIIGNGPDLDRLKKLYGDCKNISFLGWKTKVEVVEYYKSIKCLVFPSIWFEGAPLTIPEVQSFGIPCIVSDACSGTDYIHEGINGYVFKSKNVNCLANCLLKLNDMSREEYLSMRKATFEISQVENFNLQKHIGMLIEVYNKREIKDV